MKKLALFSATAFILTAGTAAIAKPDAPWQAAETDKGTACWVRGSEIDTYVLDTSWTFHVVRKRDKDGNLTDYSYQDKGKLQEGQTVPETPYSYSESDDNCVFTERATPSGNYQSNQHCKF